MLLSYEDPYRQSLAEDGRPASNDTRWRLKVSCRAKSTTEISQGYALEENYKRRSEVDLNGSNFFWKIQFISKPELAAWSICSWAMKILRGGINLQKVDRQITLLGDIWKCVVDKSYVWDKLVLSYRRNNYERRDEVEVARQYLFEKDAVH